MSINFSSTTPAAPSGSVNVTPQNDGAGNMSFYVPESGVVLPVSILEPTLTADFNAGSPQTLVTPAAPSVYRISFSQALEVVDAVSSTMPSLTLGWSDPGGIARTKTLVPTDSTNVTTAEYDGDAIIYTNGSTPVTVTSTGYASNTPATMTYALAVVIEEL
jgi:hypothetical protein